MIKVNLAGNWMDELCKIGENKGWLKEGQFSKQDAEKYWGSLPREKKDQLIPGWDSMLYNDLVNNLELKWGAIINAYRELEQPKKPEAPKAEEKSQVNPQLIGRVQAAIMKVTGIPVSNPSGETLGAPDGVWGPRSAMAWNQYVETFNKNGPVMIGPVDPSGRELPRVDDMRYVARHAQSRNASSVYEELGKLSQDLQDMGETKVAAVIKNQQEEYKQATQKLYDIMGETGEQLINKVHPEGGKTLLPVEDEGGKVETILEQNKKMMDVFNKKPTGKYSNLILDLIKTANRLEDGGNHKAAAIVDKTIEELYEVLPFVNRSSGIEATGSEDYNASKTAGADELKQFVPQWDKIVNKFDSIADEITSWTSVIESLVSHSVRVRNAYRKVRAQIYSTANAWKAGQLSPSSLAEEIKNIAKTLDVNEAGKGIRGMFEVFGFNANKVNRIVSTHFELIADFQNLARRVENYKPEPEQHKKQEEKPEVKPEEQFVEQLKIKYLTELKRFENTILQNAEKIHKVLLDPKGLLNWIEKRKYNLTNDKSKHSYNPDGEDVVKMRKLVNELQKRLGKTASLKLADDAIPAGIFKEDEKPAPSVAKKPRRKKIVEDSDVKTLQNLLQKLDHNPGPPDGVWGRKTSEAWNAFLDKAPIGFEKYMAKVNINAQKHQNRPIQQIKNAITLMNYLLRKQKEKSNTIPLGPIDVPMSALLNPKVFVSYMKGTLNTKKFPPKTALEYLKEMENYIDTHEYDLELSQKGLADRWKRQIQLLTRQFSTMEATQPVSSTNNFIFVYPWEKGVVEPNTDKKRDFWDIEKREVSRGRLNRGIKGLFYPTEFTKASDIIIAINSLPSAKWLGTLENFYLRAEADMAQINFPGKARDKKELVKQYWNLLYKRLKEILGALKMFEKEIKARSSSTFKDIEDTITQFNNELQWVGNRIGAD